MLLAVNKLIGRRWVHGLMICAAVVSVLICYSQLSVTAEDHADNKPVDETAALIDGADWSLL